MSSRITGGLSTRSWGLWDIGGWKTAGVYTRLERVPMSTRTWTRWKAYEKRSMYGHGERVGVLTDMDSSPRTLLFFRDDVRLEGMVCEFPARPAEFRIAMNCDEPGTVAL